MDRRSKDASLQSRERLAANINALIEEGITSPSRLVDMGAITPSTLARIRAGTHAAYIDHLDKLAFALAIEPWQLLHPDPAIADLEPERVHAWERLIPPLLMLDTSQLPQAVAQCERALQPLVDAADKLRNAGADEHGHFPQRGGARNTPRRNVPAAKPPVPAKRAKR